MLFENSFVTTPICAASRACILAGQHQRTTGIKDFDRPFSPEALAQTYPLLLKQAGYRIGFIGKWGVGATPAQMKYPASQFDYWRGWPGQAGFWYDDKSLRVPTIFYDPRRPENSRGKRLQPMVLSMDLAPTMLDLAGVAKPPSMQGASWLPLLDNPTAPWRTDWYYGHTFTTRPPEKIAKSEGVRTERWKYIR